MPFSRRSRRISKQLQVHFQSLFSPLLYSNRTAKEVVIDLEQIKLISIYYKFILQYKLTYTGWNLNKNYRMELIARIGFEK